MKKIFILFVRGYKMKKKEYFEHHGGVQSVHRPQPKEAE